MYETKFLLLGLLVSFTLGFLTGKLVYQPNNLLSPAVAYETPKNYQIYGEGTNPKYKMEEVGRNRSTNQEGFTFKERVDAYVCDPKFTWDCAKVKRIIFCESSYREKVISHTGDVGVMQIAPVHNYSVAYLSDYRNNIDVGYKLFLARGYQPWASSARCWKIK